jgi:hypothetical protein
MHTHKNSISSTNQLSKSSTGSTHTTPANGNVFLDLGFSSNEAKELFEESQRRIDIERASRRCKKTS